MFVVFILLFSSVIFVCCQQSMYNGDGGSHGRGTCSKLRADVESEVECGVKSSIPIAATAVVHEPVAMNVSGGTNSWQ